MANIGEILRQAREEKGRSLDDIAAATHINKKFLEEIERGNFPKLPDTYIRAFIRSYALEVDIDPNRLMIVPNTASLPERPVFSAPVAAAPSPASVDSTTTKSSSMKGNPTLILLFVAALAVVSLVLIVIWMRSERAQKPVQEVSFSDVVREQESSRQADSQPTVTPDSSTIAGRDSLVLEAVTSGSEWIRIVCDTIKAKEYTLPSGSSIKWKAKNYFVLSVGNAKAISFKLNNKNVGLPSNAPINLSNIRFSWNTLDTLSKKIVPDVKGNKDSLSKAAPKGKGNVPVSTNTKARIVPAAGEKLKTPPKKPR